MLQPHSKHPLTTLYLDLHDSGDLGTRSVFLSLSMAAASLQSD
jgi:hypothetical protein